MLSGKEPFDAGRQVSCIFPALGLAEGEAKLKAVLLPGLAGGCLGGHVPAASAAPWAPGSLTWRPVPPGLTRAGTRLLSPSSPPHRVPSQAARGTLFRPHAGAGEAVSPSPSSSCCLRGAHPPPPYALSGRTFQNRESCALLSRGRWKGPLLSGAALDLP